MPTYPITPFTWRVLRALKRSSSPPTGRTLRLDPTPRTRDGTFLNHLVEEGLLTRATGSAAKPFEATYSLTERGEYAAEFGEYTRPPKRSLTPAPAPLPPPKKSKKR